MFRKVRLDIFELPREKGEEMFANCNHAVLALNGDDGYPYSVPVSQVCRDGTIYFHGGIGGYKYDAICRDEKASICVVARDDKQPDKFVTFYESAIAFGRVKLVEDDAEKRKILEYILEKYSQGFIEEGKAYIEKEWDRVAVYKMDVEHLTAKGISKLPG